MRLIADPAVLHRHPAFRDRLRADPALAREYAALKRRLAARHADDREAYTTAKSGFIRLVAGERQAWRPAADSNVRTAELTRTSKLPTA